MALKPIDVVVPTIFIPSMTREMFVMNRTIAVFNKDEAEVVFSNMPVMDLIQVWCIKDGRAEMVPHYAAACEFFDRIGNDGIVK